MALWGKKVEVARYENESSKKIMDKVKGVGESIKGLGSAVANSKVGRLMGSKYLMGAYYTVKGYLWMDKTDKENRQ